MMRPERVLQHRARALIEPLNEQEARPMTDRNDPPSRPWPEVTDLSRLYDHGQPWCANARAHPDLNGGYPDADRHLPWHECRSNEAFVDDARRNLDSDELGLTVYLASAFRFGELRDTTESHAPRVVIETWPSDADGPSQRVSMGAGSALRLARILVRFADELTFVERVA
jgi:hypothetical protein